MNTKELIMDQLKDLEDLSKLDKEQQILIYVQLKKIIELKKTNGKE